MLACLQSARLLVAASMPHQIPVHANELLRPLINQHAHARRSSKSVLRALFPEVASWWPTAAIADEDMLFDDVIEGL